MRGPTLITSELYTSKMCPCGTRELGLPLNPEPFASSWPGQQGALGLRALACGCPGRVRPRCANWGRGALDLCTGRAWRVWGLCTLWASVLRVRGCTWTLCRLTAPDAPLPLAPGLAALAALAALTRVWSGPAVAPWSVGVAGGAPVHRDRAPAEAVTD